MGYNKRIWKALVGLAVMKNFLLTWMSVAKEIMTFKPTNLIDKIVLKWYTLVYTVLYNNTRIDED